MKTVLVIDFDDTLTALPKFWKRVIEMAREYDQRVICITQRLQDGENIDIIDEWLHSHDITIATYYTNGMSKVDYIEEVLQLTKYILCDDNPRRAVNGV